MASGAKTTELKNLKLTFDVGHGHTDEGWDPGAVSRSLVEYELNRIAVNEAAALMKSAGAIVKINDYSKGSTKRMTLQQKGLAAGDCNIFISVHHNAASSASAQGSEVYFHTSGSNSDKKLAQELQSALMKHLWKNDQNKNRGAKSSRLAILGAVPKNVPAACLTEAFFVTDTKLDLAKGQELSKKSAAAFFEGVKLYWKFRQTSLSLFGEDETLEWPIEPYPEEGNEEFREHHKD